MGFLPDFYGKLSGQCQPCRTHRHLLCHAGHRITLHAGHHGHHSRPLGASPKAIELQPLHGSHLHGTRRLLWYDKRTRRGIRTALRPLCPERSLLYADPSPFELRGLYGAGQSGAGHHQAFPPYPYLWNHRIHLRHVAGRHPGPAEQLRTVLHLRHHRPGVRVLRPDPACLPHEQGRTEQIAGRSIGPACLHPVQAKENGHLLHLLHAAGRVTANHQRICQPLYQQLRQHT